jgi:hypothetical protein
MLIDRPRSSQESSCICSSPEVKTRLCIFLFSFPNVVKWPLQVFVCVVRALGCETMVSLNQPAVCVGSLHLFFQFFRSFCVGSVTCQMDMNYTYTGLIRQPC